MAKLFAYALKFARLILFLLLLAFAAKNTETVTVNFFLGHAWQLPLSLLLLIFFVMGACLALLACVARSFRDKREIRALKAMLDQREDPGSSQPPSREVAY